MGISVGSKLGPYQVTDAIGAGGMGEVYKALDTRLERTVAIKVLPDHLANDPQRRERFQREAKAISGLSHPNICALYDVGEQDGMHYLVLEYIEGESLADRLRKGPLPISEVLKIGAEIASALDTAHRRGIVHRDLKPANVMLTRTGAKLLDFGLAKPVVAAAAASGDAATLAKSLTEEGTIVGTFQYMAPEQLEGSEADARSDIFAFGTILYEMATGKAAFGGKSRVSLIASILSSDPKPVTDLAPTSPPSFAHLVRTCLEKDPEQRFQSAHDLLLELRWVSDAGSQIGAAPVLARRHKMQFRAAWAVAAVSTLALLLIAAIWLLRPASAPLPAVRAYLQPPKGSTFGQTQVAVSPDGSKLVYRQTGVTTPRLFIQSLASGIAQPISDSPDAIWPFFSPDGKSVAFCDGTKLQKYDVTGGQLITISDAGTCGGGSWNAAGTILFGSPKGIMQVPSGGGAPEVAFSADNSTRFYGPSFLPDGRHFLVAVRTNSKNAGDAPDNALSVADLKTHTWKVLLQTGTGSSNAAIPIAQYASGFVVYVNNGNLMSRPFDPDKLRFTGDAVALGPRAGLFGVSSSGVLAYFAPGEQSKSELRWVGRSGQQLGRIAEAQMYDNVRLSPDGSRVAYQLYNGADGSATIWVYDVSRAVSSRVTFENSVNDDRPVWSPDGKYLLYNRNQDDSMRKVLASGLGGDELVLEKAYPDDWSPDGRFIAYDAGTPPQIGIYDVSAKKSSFLLSVKSANHDARFSPDGKFLAYTSEESGQSEIYVVPFPNLTQKWQVSSGGGTRASWRRDGKELYYLSPDGKLMAVPVNRNGDNLNFGTPVALFQAPFETGGANITNVGRPYDPAADGQKFVMNSSIETSVEPLTLVTNWTSLLKK
jgi:Tol biopolymer transport system component/tRNA A-37 threonylcarbamoyl transferase component Bud32